MELIDNINKTLKGDLTKELHGGSKVAIAASCFSIYAFEELKAQLKDIEELRFIFTSPTFVTEKANKQKREFYIPRLNRERNLYGSEFEIKLRNELSQKAIAKECAEWIRRKACFKSNYTGENMMGFATVDDKAYMPVTGFTTVELGCERGDNAYSELLDDAISSIIHVKEGSDIDSFLSGVQGSLFTEEIRGLDDFELICFLVVK